MRILRIGPFEMNVELLALRKDERVLAVGPKVAQTLLVLADRPGVVVSKEMLLARVWPEGFAGEANLSQNIYVLRKLFRESGLPNAIATVPGAGYRLTVPVQNLQCSLPHRRSLRKRSIRVAVLGAAAIALAAWISAFRPSAFPEAGTAAALPFSGDETYAIGRYYLDQRSRDGVRKSLEYFTKAVDNNPYDARPYAALADANVVMGDYCYGMHRPRVYFDRAGWYVRRALALDPRSAEAHASAGFLAMHVRDERLAEAELHRAIRLNSAYAPAHQWLALLLLLQGSDAAAAKELKTAVALDPLSIATLASLARVSYEQHRYADAVTYAKMTLELQPQRADALLTLGRAYVAQHLAPPSTAAIAQLPNHPTWASIEDGEHR